MIIIILILQCNEWPWQVGIVARAGDDVSVSPFCGGTLINEKYHLLGLSSIGYITIISAMLSPQLTACQEELQLILLL